MKKSINSLNEINKMVSEKHIVINIPELKPFYDHDP